MLRTYILQGSGKLTPFVTQIQEQVDKTVTKIEELAPNHDIDIVVYDNPDGAIQEIGVGGYTPNANLVFIYLDPGFQDFTRTLDNELGRMLTHELSHTIRWNGPGYGTTLFEALITEGLGDHFEIEINKTKPQPWDLALTPEQLKEVEDLAQKEYDNQNYNHYEWFVSGSKEKGIPKWAGYSLGFKLVKDYLEKHLEVSASELLSQKPEKFLT